MNMIEILLSRSKGSKATAQPPRPPASRDPIDPPPRKIQPYEVPCPDGKNRLVELPEEALVKVMTLLDRTSLTRCFRLCKAINELCNANSSIALHHLLLCNSLILNANILQPSTNINLVPPSTAQLLNTLRERLTRFRNIAPKSQHRVKFEEKEGNLYEYLEGVLLRGVSRGLTTGLSSNQVAIYDLRQLNDWEDIEPATGRMDPEATVEEDDDSIGFDGGNAVGDLPARVRDSLETMRRKRRRSEAALGPDGQPEEIEETTESEAAAEVRTLKSFPFTIREFAVDPGQDLLVLVEVKTDQGRAHSMYIHLVTLSTFEPHPRAKVPVLKWPETLARPRVTLNFQICDDGLFVMLNNSFDGPVDSILGWQWTTGHHAMTLKAQRNMTFESFILLSPSSLVIPAVVSGVDPDSDIQHQLENGDDLIFRHELRLYAFPPLSTISTPGPGSSAPVPPPHAGTHVATLDLPEFYTNLGRNIPPPRLIIRADPPPRRTLPTHPLGVTGLQQFVPEPTSGVVVVEFLCQMPDMMVNPHYVMLVMKEYLSSFCLMSMAAIQSQVFPRQAPVIAWDTIRHHVRLFGPNLRQSSWVCYVYQNRYVTTRLEYDDDDEDEDDEESDLPMGYIRLYDFDPLRVRKEICDRKYDIIPLVDPTIPLDPNTPNTANTGSTSPQRQSYTRRMSNLFRRPASIDGDKTGDQATPDNPLLQPLSGDRNGIVLVTEETHLADELPLMSQIFTGSKLPYIYAERETIADTVLIDGERIIGVLQDSWPEGGDDEDEEAEEAIELEVSDF